LSTDQQQIANNIAGRLRQCTVEVQGRMLSHFDKVDPKYGLIVRNTIAQAISLREAS